MVRHDAPAAAARQSPLAMPSIDNLNRAVAMIGPCHFRQCDGQRSLEFVSCRSIAAGRCRRYAGSAAVFGPSRAEPWRAVRRRTRCCWRTAYSARPRRCCIRRWFAAAADRPQVALTFDDGPDPEITPAVLDIAGRIPGPRHVFRHRPLPGKKSRRSASACIVKAMSWAITPGSTRNSRISIRPPGMARKSIAARS